MANRLFFNAREWSFNKACERNVGERCFINGIDGKLTEIFSIGNWGMDWTEIMTRPMTLEKNTEYSFCFWLNGGEDDRDQEVCQLRIVFDEDHENCLIYKLNRGYIKPLKRYKGWELYDIPFTTGESNTTILKFAARSAYMAVHPAKEPEAYGELAEVLDEYDGIRPQRHNIVFEDGWPTNSWYSTKELRRKQEAGRDTQEAQNLRQDARTKARAELADKFSAEFGPKVDSDLASRFGPKFAEKFGPDFAAKFGHGIAAKFGKKQTQTEHPENTDAGATAAEDPQFSQIVGEIKKRVRNNILGDIDIDDIVDDITDEIDADDIMEEVKAEIDIDSLREEIKKEIFKRMK